MQVRLRWVDPAAGRISLEPCGAPGHGVVDECLFESNPTRHGRGHGMLLRIGLSGETPAKPVHSWSRGVPQIFKSAGGM